ncbi:MAG: SDR family NAD(P)-dependent oxidoreductase [Ignavibacteriaceae bacterium]
MNERELSIVTGASRGIGKGIALRLAEEDHDVMIFGRDTDALKDVQKEIKNKGVECDYFSGDVADFNFVNDSVNKILSDKQKIDHLVNNAGIGIMKKVIDADLDDFKKQVDANLFGVFNFSKAVLNSMIVKQKGSIINIASLAGKNSFVGGSMYSATKHAVLGFARSLMLEVRQYNIKVATICPGSVDTRFGSGGHDPRSKGEILQPEDVAEAVVSVIKLPVRALISEIDLRPTNPKKQ